MRRRKTQTIKQRERILLACEGESERSYGALLQHLANDSNLHIHIDVKRCIAHSGGDLLALMKGIIPLMQKEERRAPYKVKAILLDSDLRQDNIDRDQAGLELAHKHNMLIIWQIYEHEAFLLRHLPACKNKKPTKGQGEWALRQALPNYTKPFPKSSLVKHFQIAQVRQATTVEVGLKSFLSQIGWDL